MKLTILFVIGSTAEMVQDKYLELRTEQLDVLQGLKLSEPIALIRRLPASGSPEHGNSNREDGEDDQSPSPMPATATKGKARATTSATPADAPAAGMLTWSRQQMERTRQLEREEFEADQRARFEVAEALVGISTPTKHEA